MTPASNQKATCSDNQGNKKGAPMGALFLHSHYVTQLAGAGREIRELALHLRTGGIRESIGAASM